MSKIKTSGRRLSLYVDKGLSNPSVDNFKIKFPKLKSSLIVFMKKGDCLIVWKLDRLGRSLPHLTHLTHAHNFFVNFPTHS